jgi:hypothetical protein
VSWAVDPTTRLQGAVSTSLEDVVGARVGGTVVGSGFGTQA